MCEIIPLIQITNVLECIDYNSNDNDCNVATNETDHRESLYESVVTLDITTSLTQSVKAESDSLLSMCSHNGVSLLSVLKPPCVYIYNYYQCSLMINWL